MDEVTLGMSPNRFRSKAFEMWSRVITMPGSGMRKPPLTMRRGCRPAAAVCMGSK